MKLKLQIFSVFAIGIVVHARTTHQASSDDMQPDQAPGILQPEWQVFQRSPEDIGNAEAW